MRRAHYFLNIIVFVALAGTALFGSEIPVSIDDLVYGFLKRMETRGIVTNYNDTVLPLTRDDIAGYLTVIQKKTGALSKVEKKLLKEHLADYRYELSKDRYLFLRESKNYWTPIGRRKNPVGFWRYIFDRRDGVEKTHLFVFEEDDHFLWFDAGFKVQEEWKDSQSRYLLSDRYGFRGALGNQLSFSFELKRFVKEYNPQYAEPSAEEVGYWSMFQADSSISFDNYYSSLTYRHRLFDIGIYQQPVLWGVSHVNDLVLSNSSSAFPYVGFSTKFKSISFKFIHAWLSNDSTRFRDVPRDVRDQPKYLAAHRIDIPLFDGRTSIGFTDIIVYGGRSVELAYLLPVNFFWSAEHALHDRDNSLLSVDIKSTLVKNITVYGAVLIDELRFGELGQKWWANKHAVQGGVRWSPHFFGAPIDVQGEFTAIRPWTYTHKTYFTNYTHNGICLGAPFGPNSQQWFLRMSAYLSRRLHVLAEYRQLKRGVDGEGQFWGGDVEHSYTLKDPSFDHKTEWLMGPLETTQSYRLSVNYELFNDLHLFWETSAQKISFKENSQKCNFMILGIRMII